MHSLTLLLISQTLPTVLSLPNPSSPSHPSPNPHALLPYAGTFHLPRPLVSSGGHKDDNGTQSNITLVCADPGPQCVSFPPDTPKNESVGVRMYCVAARLRNKSLRRGLGLGLSPSPVQIPIGKIAGRGSAGRNGNDGKGNGEHVARYERSENGEDVSVGRRGSGNTVHGNADPPLYALLPAMMYPCPRGAQCSLYLNGTQVDGPDPDDAWRWYEDENGTVPGLKDVDFGGWITPDEVHPMSGAGNQTHGLGHDDANQNRRHIGHGHDEENGNGNSNGNGLSPIAMPPFHPPYSSEPPLIPDVLTYKFTCFVDDDDYIFSRVASASPRTLMPPSGSSAGPKPRHGAGLERTGIAALVVSACAVFAILGLA
ncbi:hypothetical protein F4777DRAFT_489938 [Nemania sp. FL0916]|nr:hypothetical protein F4777DRAFT_489938 [Nemania sp. FL0916]